MKKVSLGVKPQSRRPATADEWVNAAAPQTTSQNASQEAQNTPPSIVENFPMKRLTIDVPESLHAQIKSVCALKGVKMADEIRTLLQSHFPNVENS